MYDSILKLFISKSISPEYLRQANTIGDHVYASDKKVFIRIPSHLLAESYPPHQKVGDIMEVLQSTIDSTTIIDKRINVLTLRRVLSQISSYPKYGECICCEGLGEIECDKCNEYHDCPACVGTGTSDEKIGVTWKSNTLIEMYGAYLFPGDVSKLLSVFDASPREMYLNRISQYGANVFAIGDVIIGIMAVLPSGTSEEVIYSYTEAAENCSKPAVNSIES